MALQLKRPLVVFDLETTGVDVSTARIVEVAMLRVEPNGEERKWVCRVNPGIPIPPATSAVHGIFDEDVANAPCFAEVMPKVLEFIEGADLGGYNSSRFDIPLLVEECARNGVELDLSQTALVDAMAIFSKMEPRTLVAAYKKFCGKDLEHAHSAMADTEATKEVLFAQVDYYENVPQDIEGLAKLCRDKDYADLAGRLGYDNEDEVVFKFGKYKGMRVMDVFRREPSYFTWIMNSDFPVGTKALVKHLYHEVKGQ